MGARGVTSSTRRRPADRAVPVACAHQHGETPRRIIDMRISMLQDCLAGYLDASRHRDWLRAADRLNHFDRAVRSTANDLGLTLSEHDGRLRSLVADTGAACISLTSQQTRLAGDLGQLVATIRVYADRVDEKASTGAADMERVGEA